MNKEQTKQAIAVMQGFVDGKTIQYSPYDNGHWATCAGFPVWEWNKSNYRIKPEVVKYRRYLYKDDLGRPLVYVSNCRPRDITLQRFSIESSQNFIRWIDTEWQEIEV